MTVTQKVILVALLTVGVLCLIVGFTLMHYIGGFLRTMEEEAREQERQDADSEGGKEPPEAGKTDLE